MRGNLCKWRWNIGRLYVYKLCCPCTIINCIRVRAETNFRKLVTRVTEKRLTSHGKITKRPTAFTTVDVMISYFVCTMHFQIAKSDANDFTLHVPKVNQTCRKTSLSVAVVWSQQPMHVYSIAIAMLCLIFFFFSFCSTVECCTLLTEVSYWIYHRYWINHLYLIEYLHEMETIYAVFSVYIRWGLYNKITAPSWILAVDSSLLYWLDGLI